MRFLLLCRLSLCLAWLPPCGAWANSTNVSVRPLSLADCFKIALEHNLDVKIARYNPEIQSHNLSAAYGAYEPVLGMSATRNYTESPGGFDSLNRPYPGTTSYEDSFVPGITGILPTGLSYNIGGTLNGTTGSSASGPFITDSGQASVNATQPLLRNSWIDAPREIIQVNKKELKISELALRRQIMSSVTSVELAYYNLILAQEQVRVEEQAFELAQRLVNESKAKVAAGSMAPFDEKQAESQLSSSQADLLGAKGAFLTQDYALKNLLSDRFAEWDGVRIQPTEKLVVIARDFNLAESWRRGLSQRPDFLQAKTGLEQQGIVLKYLRNQIYPELDLVGSYAQAGVASTYNGVLAGIQAGTSPAWGFGMQLTLPLAGNHTARETYRANKSQLAQQTVQLKQLEQNIMVEIGVSVEQARTCFGQVDATRQSRLFAEMALDAAQKQLDNGRTTSFVVVQLQRDLTTARLAELTAVAQYNQALSNLALNEGSTLERDNLVLQVK
jgi:outer membrane protein TolC